MENGDRDPYGSVTLGPRDDVVAGSFATWEITYTVGAIGMDDGGRLKIAANVTSDWGQPQFDDPGADNYATIETSGDATVEAEYNERGYVRPMRNTIDIGVSKGALDAGDTVTLTLGDRSQGSLGHQVQTYPERDFEMLALLDAFETGEFVRVPGDLTFDVIPGPAESLTAVAPSQVTLGESVDLSVRAEDAWGNAATGYEGTLWVENADTDDGRPRAEFVEGTAHPRVELDTTGVHRIEVVDDRGVRTTTNPISCTEEPPEERLFWGDIHGQSGETVGTGTITEYFDYAKEKAFLDFASHAGNDFQITDEFWDTIQDTIQAFDTPDDFVTFLCYEWSANTPNGGDHNVYFLGDEADINRSSSWQVKDGDERHHGTFPVEELYATYEGRDDVLIIPHQGGRPATLDVYDSELTPFIEIVSVWGVFEWFAHEAFDRGYDVGLVGGSDDHTGRLGASYPANVGDWSFPIKGGMMGVHADSLTRESLWEAFKSRRCYATTGARIALETSIDGHPMGSAVEVPESPTIEVSVRGTSPITEVELFRGADRVGGRDFTDGEEWIECRWTGASSKDRHKVQDWSGGLTIDAGRIVDAEGFGFDHPQQGVREVRGTVVRWRASTAGNYQGIYLDVDAPEDATLSVSTPPVSTTVALGDLDRAHSIDAGHLDRRLTLRRTGRSRTLETDLTFTDAPEAGRYPYYVRVRQEGGEMAWSSPIFVTIPA